MRKTFTIWRCDTETSLRLRVMAVSKGVTVAKMLEQLVNERWDKEESVDWVTGRKIRKIAKRWLWRL